MFQTFKNAWKIEDLRKRILFTAVILLLFRLGSAIPVPFVDVKLLSEELTANSGTIFGFFDMMSGGSFTQASIFALGVSPYINSSIIVQLLQVIFPSLERLSREGEEGRRKLARITRYAAVVLSVLLGAMYYLLIRRSSALIYTEGFAGIFSAIVVVACFAAGAMVVLWLGEQIDAKGIGSGVSLIIFTGIVANMSTVIPTVISYFQFAKLFNQPKYYFLVPLVAVLFFGMFLLIIVSNAAERRIPVQYAKRVVGRKMYGGQSTYLPMKVNMSGVMPIIFAQTIASLPATIGAFVSTSNTPGTFWYGFVHVFDTTSLFYAVVYLLLIVFFSYFYSTIQFNPVEVANNLKKNGGFIPGFRAGKPTSEFIQKVLNKITLFGAIYLGIIAVTPILISHFSDVASKSGISLGGTSIIIVVGVALETVTALESQMLMRHYKGFLE